MRVFNLYWKIFRSYLGVIFVYVGIFLLIGIAVTSSNSSVQDSFDETKIKISLNNLDEGSTLSTGLLCYLENYSEIVELDDEDIKDALYFRRIQVIITIPENFEEEFLAGKSNLIMQEKIESTMTTVALDQAINKYLNYVRVYINQTNYSLDEVLPLVKNVLENEAEAQTTSELSDLLDFSGFYYKTLSYVIISVILTVVGLITISFRKLEVRRRLFTSPYPQRKINLEMILGNFIFTVFLVILLCAVSLVLYKEALLNLNGILLVINTLIFAIAALSMAYFFSLLISREQVLSGFNNVFSLGTSFITGAFVPQALLGSGMLTLAHIFPNYYFVYNVDLITSSTNLSNVILNKVYLYYGIQLLFAGVFIIASILVSKKQTKSEK
ncbi:MAG TPA: ABC transporter permease [Acholeplasmataceae bacterium]|nr:ABC transporter permease [Acholeplasmataceae bacterium]